MSDCDHAIAAKCDHLHRQRVKALRLLATDAKWALGHRESLAPNRVSQQREGRTLSIDERKLMSS